MSSRLKMIDDVPGHHALLILLVANRGPARHTQFGVVLGCRYNIAAMAAPTSRRPPLQLRGYEN